MADHATTLHSFLALYRRHRATLQPVSDWCRMSRLALLLGLAACAQSEPKHAGPIDSGTTTPAPSPTRSTPDASTPSNSPPSRCADCTPCDISGSFYVRN